MKDKGDEELSIKKLAKKIDLIEKIPGTYIGLENFIFVLLSRKENYSNPHKEELDITEHLEIDIYLHAVVSTYVYKKQLVLLSELIMYFY